MLTNRKYTLLAVLLTFVCYLGTTGQDVGCGDQWFDSGGESGVYANNELTTTTFCPDVDGEIVTLTFSYVDIETSTSVDFGTEGCWDFIEIFDGPDSNSPSLGIFCGEESGDGGEPAVASSLLSIGDAFSASNASGCLTVVFDSDGSVQETGWEALVSCGPPPDCVSPEISVETERNCEDFNYDAVVSIDVASTSPAPLLIITATLDGVQLGGATIPNLDGQTVELVDLPLDANVNISVDVLGASCTVTEITNISSIGCPIPLACGEGLEASYCYDNDDTNVFLYQSPNDEPVTIFFQSGLIETFGDILSIYDGEDATGELLFTGNNGGDLTALGLTANSGSLFIQLETSGFGSCQSGSSTASVWNYIVGCGDFDIPGCTDPTANNFSPLVTVDDGSCIFPPVNDEICDAEIISCNADLAGTTVAATGDNAGTCVTSNTGTGVWYEFTPEFDAIASFSTCNQADFDTKISVFTASDCEADLVCVDGLDDTIGCEGNSTLLDEVGLIQGQTYFILVHGFGSAEGTFTLSVGCEEVELDCPGVGNVGDPCTDEDPTTVNDTVTENCECIRELAPANDLICNAESISCDSEAIGTTIGTSFDDVGTCTTTNTAPGVWYEFTPENDAVASFSTCNQADFDTKISVFTAVTCEDDLECVAGLDDTFPTCADNTTLLSEVDVVAGQTYYILVHGFGTAVGNFTLSVSCEIEIACPGLGNVGDSCDDGDETTSNDLITEDCECVGTPVPANDLICNAEPISCDADAVGSTFAASFDDVGTCTTTNTAPGVWYEFTPENDAVASFSTCNQADFDTKISVFTAATCEDDLECVAGLDDTFPTCADNTTLLSEVDVVAGQTYYILVHGFGTAVGNFTLSVACEIEIACPGLGNVGDSCDDGDETTINDLITEDCECVGTPAPANDLICNAEPISCDADAVGSTFAASFDDVGTCTTTNTAPGVWYEFTPENDAVASFSTCNQADFDTKISVFTAATCEDDLECVAGLDDTFPTCADNTTLLSEVDVVAGQTYYILVHGFSTAVGNFTLSVACEVEIVCPGLGNVGDSCDDGDETTINDTITEDCECLGIPTPASQCGDYTSAPDLDFGTNQAIITDDIEVSGTNGTLTDLNVVLVIDHVWTADVEARLTSPSGAQVDLVIGECGSDDNINVLMDDDGPALTCATGSNPVLFGTFAPEGSLADFNGEVFNGTWTLEVEDNFAAEDDGTLVSWCLIPTLESTANPECENAMAIGATPEFAGSETAVSMANAVASGEAQCINGDNPQSDMWFSFESVTTNMYIRAWGLNDFDAAVEVYDSCGGELLNCQNDEPSGEREIVIVTNTTVGETYYFRVYHAGDAAPVEQDYTVAVAHIPFTQLSADDCGVLDYTPADLITTDLPVNQFLLTNWYFEFTELEAPFNTYEILSPNGANPNFLLEWFPQAEYGRTYEVRTRARMYQGPQWGDYGDACTIGFSSVPLRTKLIDEQVLGFYNMCDVLEADNVPGAETYRWKFFNGIDDPLIYDSPNRFCQLDLVEGLELGSPYAVAIRVLTLGVAAPQGPLRLIAMNSFVPDTELDGNITDCGSTIPLNTVVSAINICAAEFYTFRFTNISDANQADIFFTRDDGLRSINLNSVTGLIAGDTYSVQVLGGSGGLIGQYADACEITIAGAAPISELNSGSSNEQLSDVAIELYPNPTSGEEVMMNLSNLSEEQQEVMVEVYDLYGKKVHAEVLGNNGSQMNAVIRLPELASGIYTVNVVVNEVRVGAKKLVVR